jgi:uncharacterized protein (TIGR00255 family)
MNDTALFSSHVAVSLQLVRSYIEAIEDIQQECDLAGSLTMQDIIHLPHVFSTPEQRIDELIKEELLDTVRELIEDVVKARTTEGKVLLRDCEQRCALLKKTITAIEKQATKLMTAKKAEVHATLQEMSTDHPELRETKRQQLDNELNRLDIHEELVRFTSHLENFVEQLDAAGEEKGRKLDFTLQELAREANTMASKSSDASISSAVINIKVELEKLREQAQNIV